MAEKLPIFELEIELGKAQQDVRATKIAIEELKKESQRLKETEGELSDAYIESQASLKVLQSELRTNERLTQNVISANNANTGSVDQLRKQLAVVSVQWAKLSEDERRNTDQGKLLTKQKLQLTNALKAEERATGDARRNVGNYNESISNSLGLFSQFVPAIGRASTAARGLGKAFTVALGPLGLVVAAIALVVGGLKAFFTASEEGQDAWDEFGSTTDVIIGNITDRLSDLGEAILKPKETINEISNFFSKTFGQYWGGIIDKTVAQFKKFFNSINLEYQKFKDIFTDNAKAIEEAQKKIEESNKKIEEANKKIIEGIIATKKAYDEAKKSIKDFNEETQREIEIAQKLAKQQASLNKQARNSLISNARDEEKIAELRAKVAQKEVYDSKQRLQFLDEAIKLEQEVLKRNLSIAQQKAYIKTEQNKLSKSTREDLDEEAKLIADIYKTRTQNFEKTRRLELERSTLLKQIREEEQAGFKKGADEFERALLEEAEAAKRALEDAVKIQKQADESRRSQREQATQQRMLELDAEYEANKNNVFRTLDLEDEKLQLRYDKEIEFAHKIGADTTYIEQKYANASIEIERAKKDAKFALAEEFAGNLATIFGEQTAVGKAAAVAETTINTYRSATAAYSALAGIPVVGPALGAVAAAAAVAAGLKNVKEILAVKTGLPGDSTPNVSTPSAVSTPTQVRASGAPSINEGIVSRETIVANTEQPKMQTAVVIDEVTKKQATQKNISVASNI